jgi:hypothetical protein
MLRTRLEALLLALLLVLVAGVCVTRGGALVREPLRLDAHEERGWFEWSYPHPEAPALFARAARELVPGEVICLVVPKGPESAVRFQFLANYYLPDQTTAAVWERGTGQFPPLATVVVINRQGEVRVRRGVGRGQPG